MLERDEEPKGPEFRCCIPGCERGAETALDVDGSPVRICYRHVDAFAQWWLGSGEWPKGPVTGPLWRDYLAFRAKEAA